MKRALFLAVVLSTFQITAPSGPAATEADRGEPRPVLLRLGEQGSIGDPFLQATSGNGATAGAAAQARVRETYGKFNLSFEANRGQSEADVEFLSRGDGYTLLLKATEVRLVLDQPDSPENLGTGSGDDSNVTSDPPPTQQSVLRMRLVGANPSAEVTGLDQLPGESHYLLGNDPTAWHTNVPHFAKVGYRQVYPGVDMVFYGTPDRQLEFDFVVAPGADYKAIALDFSGAEAVEIDERGDLRLRLGPNEISLPRPVVYQEIDGVKREISGEYAALGAHTVGLSVGVYDPLVTLIIDPRIEYSTYLGGRHNDEGFAIALEPGCQRECSAYVTGRTQSRNFPGPRVAANAVFQEGFAGGSFADVFVAKLNADGTDLVYRTYLGGTCSDTGYGIAVDDQGNAYVAGSTLSDDFPQGETGFARNQIGNFDAFVVKLNGDGSRLLYSTYLGGRSPDRGWGIAVDRAGNAYVTGSTHSEFPTQNASQPVFGGGTSDAFVAKLNAAGDDLVYSTYLGGAGEDEGRSISLDPGCAGECSVYITGRTRPPDEPGAEEGSFPTTEGVIAPSSRGETDAFVAKLNAVGGLVYSTYLGGSENDWGASIAVDDAGNAYVTGRTLSGSDDPGTPNVDERFPLENPLQPEIRGNVDAFVTKLNADGTNLVYSSFFGGGASDYGQGIAVRERRAYVAGEGSGDFFVVQLNEEGNRIVDGVHYHGGSNFEYHGAIAVDNDGMAYVTGTTVEEADAPAFPVVPENDAFQTNFAGHWFDAFVAKIYFGEGEVSRGGVLPDMPIVVGALVGLLVLGAVVYLVIRRPWSLG